MANAIARRTPSAFIWRTVLASSGSQFLFPQYSGRSMPASASAAAIDLSISRHWALIGLTPPTA